MDYKKLIGKYKTPMFLYDSNVLCKRINYIKSKLNKDYKIIYAIKANTFILKELDDLVDGYEICSYGEYEICKHLSLNNEKFVISGVNKEEYYIEEMLNDNVTKYTIESLNHYLLFEKLTKKLHKKIKILIRLTSGNQFGVSKEDFIKVIELNKDNELIKIVGIEYFTGTQKSSIKKINHEIDYIVDFINEIEKNYNLKIEEVEYGTGSPVFYFQEEFDENNYFDELNKALSKIKGKKISLEMGRTIASSCGQYITSIADIKSNKVGNTIILDGGINHLVYYGQTMAMRIPEFEIFPTREDEKKPYNLYVSLCTINDIILKKIELNSPQIGDYIVFKNTGAYSITEGIALFLSRELPCVVIYDKNGKDILVREHLRTSLINCPNIK